MEYDLEEKYIPKGVGNYSKYHRKDDVLRPGRLDRGETKYIGNSSMPPRKDHPGKGKTLRTHRKGK